ncbi:MAG: glycoside hydrolase family 43 protein [Verrucomicrobiota bacterium]
MKFNILALLLAAAVSASAVGDKASPMIENPILTGFNPDPSILRVEDDYYVATSTFMWFPGVQIHHSKDLVNWRLLTHPLTRVSQLNMDGASSSEGVWAPNLSHADGRFWLIYTNVKTWEACGARGTNNDTHNYLVTAEKVEGPWSEPIYMNSSGFDPSLFHDDDGRKWFLNMLWDFREGKQRFSGVMLQEYSVEEQKLIGEPVNIYKGSGLGGTEAPNLYKLDNGYYYLIVAEGGTEWWHAVVVARSRNIEGPYETDPGGSCITSREKPDLYLQKAGHGSLVETQNGEYYIAHLVGRPIEIAAQTNEVGEVINKPLRRCILGRETAIQKMVLTEDNWIRMADGSNDPKRLVEAPAGLKPHKFKKEKAKDKFKGKELNVHWHSPRLPITADWASLKKGKLVIRGRESMISRHNLSMVARRLKHFKAQVTTAVEFDPTNFQELAGLTAYYDERNHYLLAITFDEEKGKVLKVVRNDSGRYDEVGLFEESPASTNEQGVVEAAVVEAMVAIPESKPVYLRATIDYAKLQFAWSLDEKSWIDIGPVLDSTILSDDYDGLNFTGAFVGMAVMDYRMQSKKALFDYFEYSGR